MTDQDANAIVPDDKDWTWVLERPCPDCGFDAASVAPADVPARLTQDADGWVERLAATDDAAARRRPDPATWSLLEYACHVRDAHRTFGERVRLMLDQDDPAFENWDQDATALESGYGAQDPGVVAGELAAAAEEVAVRYAGVSGDAWQRTGRRSNGSTFTVDTLSRYHLHDVVHHSHDVG